MSMDCGQMEEDVLRKPGGKTDHVMARFQPRTQTLYSGVIFSRGRGPHSNANIENASSNMPQSAFHHSLRTPLFSIFCPLLVNTDVMTPRLPDLIDLTQEDSSVANITPEGYSKYKHVKSPPIIANEHARPHQRSIPRGVTVSNNRDRSRYVKAEQEMNPRGIKLPPKSNLLRLKSPPAAAFQPLKLTELTDSDDSDDDHNSQEDDDENEERLDEDEEQYEEDEEQYEEDEGQDDSLDKDDACVDETLANEDFEEGITKDFTILTAHGGDGGSVTRTKNTRVDQNGDHHTERKGCPEKHRAFINRQTSQGPGKATEQGCNAPTGQKQDELVALNTDHGDDGSEMSGDGDDDRSEVGDDEGDDELLVLDPKGDIMIVAGDQSTGFARFQVKSSRLREYTKWRSFLDGQKSILPDQQNRGDQDVAPPPSQYNEEACQNAPSVAKVENEETGLGSEPGASIAESTVSPQVGSPSKGRGTDPSFHLDDADQILQANIEAQHEEATSQQMRSGYGGWYTKTFLDWDGDDVHKKMGSVGERVAHALRNPSNGEPKLMADQAQERARNAFNDQNDVSAAVLDHEANELDEANNVSNASPETYTQDAQAPEHETKAGLEAEAQESFTIARISSNGSDTSKPQAIYMPDDCPEAVGITLLFMHLRFDLLPSAIDFRTIYELAVHCEKFGTEGLLIDSIGRWIERFLPRALDIGNVHWLYIAWVFRFNQLFEAHMQYFVCKSTKTELRLSAFEGHVQNLIKFAAESREHLVENILGVAAQYMDENFWHRNYTCCHSRDKQFCAEHAYISFAVKLRALGLWPTPPAASAIEISPSTLREKVFDITLIPYTEAHTGCADLVQRFQEDILFVSYDTKQDRYSQHFFKPDPLGRSDLQSMMGSYLYQYGFAPMDWGTTSVVKSAKRRQRKDLADEMVQRKCALRDHLYDDEDSDYEVTSDPESDVEERLDRYMEETDTIYELLEDLQYIDQAGRKKAKLA
ncbi:uncharacterized protein BDR25DRAFT_342382 [Lindgomyces ingoldianus]|uniref:Uncharacterized protein n=1 Tax=Lindgomyces ingoldianus TaxID=673940 RepID=A0ACB6QXE2_9PLEO|nr:uncharacterized protein BDR25DRAFT_342382 [Lindgomyces ingoldianus]KAF2471699.1 hypothetical protein BDR25DRAFT_342382 [Lindgomyces ingoldianus]